MFKLDNSFELLSSMSPKSAKSLKRQKLKKSPSKLSLKKNLRRSSIFDKKPQLNLDNSVIVLEDSFEDNPNTLTSVKVNKKEDIVSRSSESISDSQESNNENQFSSVNKWLNDNEKIEDFSEIHSFKHKTYYIDSEDESFEKSLRQLNINDEGKKPDFVNESDKSLDDSLEKPKVDTDDKNCFFTPVKKGFCETKEKDIIDDSLEENIEGYENILDDLYGTSWREKRDEILPQSERKPLRKKIQINLPQTERKPSRTNNIFGTKKSKIRESVVLRLNNLCDSDSDSNSDSDISTDSNNKNRNDNSEMTRSNKSNKKLTKKSPKIFNSSSSSDSSGINLSDSDLDLNASLRTRVQKKLFKNNIKDFSSTPKKVLKKPTTTTTKAPAKTKTTANKNVENLKISEKSLEPNQKKTVSKKIEKSKKVEKTAVQTENFKEHEKFSFLYSLSEHLPSWQSDKEARYFRDNYSKEKENLAKRLFEIFNEKVFKYALPKDTLIEWNPRINKTAGLCYNRRLTKRDGSVHRMCRIVLAPKVLTCAARLRDTLIHEMCHAATWIVNGILDGHGSQWQAWAHKARSVFPELPAISRCHNYVIETKYTYKCQGCGYSIGRHSKSLDIERKRCGLCLGKFDVFVNKKGRGGDLRTELVESKTPKKTPFADFVKEHYKSVRTANVKHAEAMKLLAAKFQEMKLKNGIGDSKNPQKIS